MIQHYLKLLWKRRNQYIFLFLELVLTFFLLIMVFQYSLKKTKWYNEPLGFEVKNQYLIALTNDEIHSDSLQFFESIDRLKKSLTALPEIEAVSLENGVHPYGDSQWSTNSDGDGFNFHSDFTIIDEDADKAWQLDITKGRFYNKEDLHKANMPIVVNQKFVNEFMNDKEPIGFKFNFSETDVIIVGVVNSFKYFGEFSEEEPFTFTPPLKNWESCNLLIIRSNNPNTAIVQKKIHNVLKQELKSDEFVIQKMTDIKRAHNNSFWVPIIGMIAIILFLIINVSLGLFGSLRFAINKRKSEIGLRKVVGADTGDIRIQIVGEVLLLMFIALIVSLFPAVQIIKFGNFEIDNEIFAKAVLYSFVLICTMLTVCSILPSQKIAKLPPAVALHED